MLGGTVLIQVPMSLTQKVSCAALRTLLSYYYPWGKLTELKLHLVHMKKKKEKS